ncbi:tetratricopeptide (TPR) repeat protein [Oxalobacteraceae bacterium GrIS 1.11]
MKLQTLMLASAVLLAACAGDGAAPAHPTATLSHVMAEADAAAKAGQYEKALATLKSASAAYPADKAPWLQMAQMKFERGSYGEAIDNALEALRRDPVDKLANSIVAVSGLRLSTKALADLTRQNNLNGSLRSEAQDLAKLLRASLGEEVLVPPAGALMPVKRVLPLKRALPLIAPKAPVLQNGTTDPFGGLK